MFLYTNIYMSDGRQPTFYYQEQKKTYFHHIIRPSSNIINIISGHFLGIESKIQFLFNHYTHISIYEIEDNKQKIVNDEMVYTKIDYICLGPKIEGKDSFLMATENSLILLSYYPENDLLLKTKEHVFLTDISPLLVRPDFIYYKDDNFCASCTHGALLTAKMNVNDKILLSNINVKKTTNVVLSTFVLNDGNHLARIEGGDTYSVYDLSLNHIVKVKPFENGEYHIFFGFPYKDGAILCCKNNNSFKFVFIDQSGVVSDVGSSNTSLNSVDSCVTSYCPYNDPSGTYKACILTLGNMIYLLNNNFEVLPFTNIFPELKLPKIMKVFSVANYVLALPQSFKEHYIKDFFWIYKSYIGDFELVPLFHEDTVPSFLTRYQSYVSILRQGFNVNEIYRAELVESARGLFYFPIGKEVINIILSSRETSRLIFADSQRNINQESVAYIESAPTIAFGCLVFDDKWIYIHISPTLFTHYPSRVGEKFEISRKCVFETGDNSFLLGEVAHRQILFINQNRDFVYLYTNKSFIKNVRELDIERHNIQGDVTCLTFSSIDSETKFAKWFALGVSSNGTHSVLLYQASPFSLDRKESTESSEISSIAFLSDDNIAVGYREGYIFIRDLKSFSKIFYFDAGEGGVLFSKFSDKTILATNSRAWLLTLDAQNHIYARPISTSSLSYVIPCFDNYFLGVSGRCLIFGQIDYSSPITVSNMDTIKNDDKVVKILASRENNLIFIAMRCSFYVSEVVTLRSTQIDTFQDSEVRDICISSYKDNSQYVVCLCKCSDFVIIRSYLAFFDHQKKSFIFDAKYHQYSSFKINFRFIGCIRLNDAKNRPALVATAENCVYSLRDPGSIGLKIYSFKTFEGTSIESFSCEDNGVNSRIYIGDSVYSITVLSLNHSNLSFETICVCSNEIRGVTCLSYFKSNTYFGLEQKAISSIVGGDKLGNIFIYSDHKYCERTKRLELDLNINVGDAITGIAYCKDIQSNIFYTTAMGAFGCFLYFGTDQKCLAFLSSKYYKYLEHIANTMKRVYHSRTQIDPDLMYSRQYISRNVADISLLDVFFFKYDEKAQYALMSEKVKREITTDEVRQLTLYYMRFRNYFNIWSNPDTEK